MIRILLNIADLLQWIDDVGFQNQDRPAILRDFISLAQVFTPGFEDELSYRQPHLWGFADESRRTAPGCAKPKSLLKESVGKIP